MMWLLSWALAGVGQPQTVPYDDDTGVVVEFPDWVRVVSPSESFDISPVEAAEDGVKHLRVVPKGEPESEVLSVSLANGSVVELELVHVEGARRYAQIEGAGQTVSARVGETDALEADRELLVAMFADAVERRMVLHEDLEFEEYPELAFELVRQHTGDEGRVGYTFRLTNRSTEALRLHPEVLSVGWPNRATLTQVDEEVLMPCGVDLLPERGEVCSTFLRLVVRPAGVVLGGAASSKARVPFVVLPPDKSKKKKKKGGR